MPREDGVRTSGEFLDTYWKWLREAMLEVDEYIYDGVDFHGYIDIVLPPARILMIDVK